MERAVGAVALANARPDGYTVSMTPITIFRLPRMENVAFDPIKDISYAIVKILHDAFRKGLEDPIHTKTLEKYNQPVWYQSSEDDTKFAREQVERERKPIERIGLAKKK